MADKIELSERSIRVKELVSDCGMGTYGLVELELKEFDKEISELKELLQESKSIYKANSDPDRRWEDAYQRLAKSSKN